MVGRASRRDTKRRTGPRRLVVSGTLQSAERMGLLQALGLVLDIERHDVPGQAAEALGHRASKLWIREIALPDDIHSAEQNHLDYALPLPG